MLEPFTVTPHTKELVLSNIAHMLESYGRCPACRTVVFCWVMHRREILDGILRRLDARGWEVCAAALVCSPAALASRHAADATAGKRDADSLERALAYLPLYAGLGLPRLDTSFCTPAEAAAQLIRMFEG